MKRFAAAALIAGLGAGTASAELINITSEKYTGGNTVNLTVADLQGPGGLGTGTTWNILSDEDAVGLLDSTGAPTGVTLTSTYGESRGTSTDWDLEVLRTYWQQFGKGVEDTFVIGGLTPGAVYNVTLTSMAPGVDSVSGSGAILTEGGAGTFSTTNTTTSASAQTIDNTAALKNTSTWVQGYNYVYFADVVVDGSGNISFLGDADGIDAEDQGLGLEGAHRLQLNSIQLELVPEPSSLALLGLGGLLIGTRRRRG